MVFRPVTVTLALQKVTAKNRELENIDFCFRRIDIDKSWFKFMKIVFQYVTWETVAIKMDSIRDR